MRNIFAVLIITFLTGSSKAQQWVNVGSGTNGMIRELAVYNGELYAGGQFTQAGGVTANGLAKWNGNNWAPVGVDANGISALYVFNNELHAAGSITSFGIPFPAVIKYDGLTWTANFNVSTPSFTIGSFVEYNSMLYGGGNINFINVGGNVVFCGDIAKWNGTMWDTVGGGIDGYHLTKLNDIEVFNNELYVGGSFQSASGLPANNIARWNGLGWDSVGSGINGTIHTLQVYNGELYSGGWLNLNNWGGYGLVKWDGTSWDYVGNTGVSGGMWTGVDAMTVFNNELVVAGDFDMVGSTAANNIASWDGTTFKAFGGGIKRRILALAEYNGELYAGGEFDSAGTTPMNFIAKWSSGVGVNENELFSDIRIFPNPSSSEVIINFSLKQKKSISLMIADITGKEVIVLADQKEFSQGDHQLKWNRKGVGAGIYNLKISTETKTGYKKVIITE